MHFADFIEEYRPVIRLIELAQLLAMRAGECSGFVAEEFTLQQFIGDRRTIHFYEGLFAAVRLRIDHARDDLFSGTALAPDEYSGGGVGNLLDGHLDLFHLRAGAKEHGELTLTPHLIAQRGIFTIVLFHDLS